MIEGLHIDITSSELKDHLAARANHHQERATWYQAQVTSLREGGIRPANVSGDPVAGLERSVAQHQQRSAFFQLLAEHLVPNEVYRLSEDDLTRVELLSRYL